MSAAITSPLTPLTLAFLLGCGASLNAVETIALLASKTTAVAINETVTVSLVMSGAAPFNGFQVYLEWDKALLELSSVPTTSLLKGNAEPFSAAPGFVLGDARIAGSGKRAFYAAAGDISPSSATLMTWTFKALAHGTAMVQTRQASPSDDFAKVSNFLGVARYPAVGPALSITIGSTPALPSRGSMPVPTRP